ncbi:hypothetical protein HYG86_15330 [Alkalicella caledoniensis]|uniref:Uncharacterized protein n=1 Tax=Alkalicella caledoniensis TaxID=2731377 RepID=A0A7G9WBH9_ALKCA|nr:hypothetical protein [Alkalicella caledoniensis]QNO16041.1 hypothetical protein HYG86_15330 [Alkalicella caledoniensis]
MNKKTLAGIIVFIVALGLFIGYPNMEESWEQRKIKTMLRGEKYEEVYEILDKESHDISSWKYVAKMQSEYYLGNEDLFFRKLDSLIKKEERAGVQYLVDVMGEKLQLYLLRIDKMGGIEFTRAEVQDIVAMSYLALWRGADPAPVIRAKEIKGARDDIDVVDLFYYYAVKDLESLLDIYTQLPDDLLDAYYELLAATIADENMLLDKEFDLDKHFEKLDKFVLPKEIEREVTFAISGIIMNILDQNHRDIFLQQNFFKNNLQFNFFYSLRKSIFENHREEAIKDMNNKEKYSFIDGYQDIIDVVNNGTYVMSSRDQNWHHLFQISKDGYMVFQNDSRRYKVNLLMGEDPEDYEYSIIHSSSHDGSYFHANIYGNPGILDSKFNLVMEFEEEASVSWVDAKTFHYGAYDNSNEEFIFNLETKERTPMALRDVKFKYLENHYGDYNYIYRFDDQTYTVIPWEEIVKESGEKEIVQYYRVRNISDNSLVFELQMPSDFMGSCNKYVYYFEERDVLQVLTGIDKETNEKVYFPFFQLRSTWNLMQFSPIYSAVY